MFFSFVYVASIGLLAALEEVHPEAAGGRLSLVNVGRLSVNSEDGRIINFDSQNSLRVRMVWNIPSEHVALDERSPTLSGFRSAFFDGFESGCNGAVAGFVTAIITEATRQGLTKRRWRY